MARLTLNLAEECIRRVKSKASGMGVKLSIAVVDETGKLVAYVRMGEKRGAFGEKLAIAKAQTAVAYGGIPRRLWSTLLNVRAIIT